MRLYVQLEETFARYRGLSELRARGAGAEEAGLEALAWARAGAQIISSAFALLEHPSEPLLATLPKSIADACVRAMGALERLCYALTALSEEDVCEEALLRPDELDGLMDLTPSGTGWS